ncbi:MAG: AraC family transcriptional regulator [Candidatus Hydrogenedentes bacterium]|nr:AraC family transcriptional regulator [Candidatus Hydrogenedentota bacterium]
MEPIALDPPRLADLPPRLVVGLCERYTMGNTGEIPSQWERFSRYVGKIPGGIDGPAYGVCFNFDNNEFDYLCGIEASDAEGLPREFSHVRIPAHRYAIFTVQENISTIQRALHTIWSEWLPRSGHKAANAPAVECYRESFDPLTGDGGFEIWLAIES